MTSKLHEKIRITGTFVDEITHDIPSQNWGECEWRREFELYREIGIDTVIIIRSGYKNKCTFESKSIPDLLPVYMDLGELFFQLADDYGLKVFLGLYDSGHHWLRGSWWKEVEINQEFIKEVSDRYGSHKSFAGWYICHETSKNALHIIEIFNELSKSCKAALDLPVLISPFPQGAKQFGTDVMSLEESLDHWQHIFAETKGSIDICAFQDGQIHYQELPKFLNGVKNLGEKHGITIWSNLESFDRDMPIKFPPADWNNLRFKLESASQTAEKIITFEFSHFMSPHSCYLSAHNLFRRYCEYVGIPLPLKSK